MEANKNVKTNHDMFCECGIKSWDKTLCDLPYQRPRKNQKTGGPMRKALTIVGSGGGSNVSSLPLWMESLFPRKNPWPTCHKSTKNTDIWEVNYREDEHSTKE